MTQFIDGEWSSGSGKVFASHSPVTGDEIWNGSASDASDIDKAVQAARAAFAAWSLTKLEDRLAIIRRFGEIVADKIGEVILVDSKGDAFKLSKTGWEHFTPN